MILRRLVDRAWYLATYADVGTSNIDAVEHYFRHGRYEGRRPSRYFDPAFYAEQAAGFAVALTGDGLAHYVGHGEAGGLRPSAHFDPAWYRQTYAIAATSNCLDHFLAHRVGGQVSPNRGFDARHYVARHGDVAESGVDPYEHWLSQGLKEGRMPMAERSLMLQSGLFDENYYLINAGDVLDAGFDALDHFLGVGWQEGRNPNPYFDTVWYTARHPDRVYANPVADYVLLGEAAGLSPGPLFDAPWYRQEYGLTASDSPLKHWLEHRRTQRFSPLPSFDVDRYIAAAATKIRPHRDPFLHALAIGALRDAARQSPG